VTLILNLLKTSSQHPSFPIRRADRGQAVLKPLAPDLLDSSMGKNSWQQAIRANHVPITAVCADRPEVTHAGRYNSNLQWREYRLTPYPAAIPPSVRLTRRGTP
jgi:hypothetical protein